jgi:hypothetical protein
MLMRQAANDVLTAIHAEERFAISVAYSDEELGQRTKALEEVAAPVVRAAAWGGFYGAPNTKALWPGLVGRLANGIDRTEKNAAHDVWPMLPLHPLCSFSMRPVSARWRAIVPISSLRSSHVEAFWSAMNLKP